MSQHLSTPRGVFLKHYIGAWWRFTRLHGDALQRYQDRRVRETICEAMARSPYYANLFAGKDTARWQTLPTTDKHAMMANFTNLNTRAIPVDRAMETALRAERERDFSPLIPKTDLTVGLSSGTSGHRGLFMVSPIERAAWAGALLARALPGSLLRRGGWRIAFFHRSGSNLYQSLSNRAISFRFFDLMTPLSEAVEYLNDFRPHLLVAPPTMLGLLARERHEGRLTIRPEKVISVAEVLEPQDAALISAKFDVPCIHQIYQCTEGLLAITCPSGALHLQEDIVAVQAAPLDTNEDSAGERKPRITPIITDLWRRVQPIIRYQLGDVLLLAPTADPPCPCGSRFRRILQVEGRSDDVVYFTCVGSSGSLRPFFPDTLRRAVLLADAEIIDYRVIQEAAGSLTIHLAIAAGARFEIAASKVRESVVHTLSAYGCRPEKLSIEQGLPDEPLSRKRRRVRRA